MPSLPDSFIHVDVPVPPQLERAIGYEAQWDDHPYCAFFWMPGESRVVYADRRRSSSLTNCEAFHFYFFHSRVYPMLRGHGLRAVDGEAACWLLLNRKQRLLYVAPAQEAKSFLKATLPTRQESEGSVLTISPSELEHGIERLLTGSIQNQMEALKGSVQAYHEMRAWFILTYSS